MAGITLWVPSVERPSWVANDSWWSLKTPDDKRIHKQPKQGANNVRYSWNKAVKDFLATDDEWLFSVHDDVVVCPDTLTRLLSWNKPLISALIFMRVGPALPHVWKSYQDDTSGRMVMRINDTREWFYKHKDWIRSGAFVIDPKPEDALVPIDFTSTSCTLIHRSVLEAMRETVKDIWFQCDDDIAGGGEDRRFFTNAAQAGFPAFVDRSCVVGHIAGDAPQGAYEFIAWDSMSVFEGTGEPQPVKADDVFSTSHALTEKYNNHEGD
jgi:hypothetical protein